MQTRLKRSGSATVEVLVGAALTVAMIGLFSALTLRIRSVDRSSIQYQVATQELANRLEPFRAMDRLQSIKALEELKADESLQERLSGATLVGKFIEDQEGSRILLELNWERTPSSQVVPSQPLRMVAWIKESIK